MEPGTKRPQVSRAPGRLSATGQRGTSWKVVSLVGEAFRSPERLRLGFLGVGLVVVVCANTGAQLGLNRWQGAFYDALEQRDLPAFLHQLLVFAGLFVVLLVLVVAQTWLSEIAKVRLRQWLAGALFDDWLQPARAFLLAFTGDLASNPDQRLHEDARHWSELTGDLAIGLLQASLLLVSFVGVLWMLSATVTPVIGQQAFAIPGFLVWCALAYAGLGSWLTWLIGRPLIRLNADRYAREAELRSALMRVGESSQAIALYRGEQDERRGLGSLLGDVVVSSRKLAVGLARLTWVTSGYGWGALVAPVLLAAPGYFAGTLSLGGLMMVVGAFNQVQQALRWFVDNFPRIADWRATLQRIVEIREALRGMEAATREAGQGTVEVVPGGPLVLDRLRLALPNGTTTTEPSATEIRPGDHVLIVGEASSGKTTLVLTLAGLWPWWSGRLVLPPREDMMVLPQRPYLPVGTLRQALAYPLHDAVHESGRVERILEEVGLLHRVPELDVVARWDRELSLEEQQLVALARLFLLAPRWVVMDEAMSALDPEQRIQMHERIARDLPGTAVLATSRTPVNGDGFFDRMVKLRFDPAAAPVAASMAVRAA
jgi:putative ATP-binding cassette transporter